MPKPSELFVGVLDFFAILLPGAIATAILAPIVGEYIVGSLIIMPVSDIGKWSIFLTFAYFLGHIIFFVGSYVDPVYNKLRELFNPYGNESAYQCATRIRDRIIDDGEKSALNTFQWARSVLILRYPDAAGDVHRLEADSKFFRSLLVVFSFGGIVFLYEGNVAVGVVSLFITIPCFARYYERRLKSTTQAYLHIITAYRIGLLNV